MARKDEHDSLLHRVAREIDPFEDGRFIDRIKIALKSGQRNRYNEPLTAQEISSTLRTLKESTTQKLSELLARTDGMPIVGVLLACENLTRDNLDIRKEFLAKAGATMIAGTSDLEVFRISNGPAAEKIGAGTKWGLEQRFVQEGYLSDVHQFHVIVDLAQNKRYAVHPHAGIRDQDDRLVDKSEGARLIDRVMEAEPGVMFKNPEFLFNSIRGLEFCNDDPVPEQPGKPSSGMSL